MALIAILNRPTEKKIGNVVIDAFIEETHAYSASATQHPTDDNSSFSDHIILNPLMISVRGVVSDTPIVRFSAQSFVDVFGGGVGRVTGDGQIVDGEQQTLRPSREKWLLLTELFERKQPVDLVTGLRVYSNYVMTGLSTRRNRRSSDIKFDATFQEFRTVEVIVEERESSSAGVKPENAQEAAADGVSSTEETGTSVASEATEEQIGAATATPLVEFSDALSGVLGF